MSHPVVTSPLAPLVCDNFSVFPYIYHDLESLGQDWPVSGGTPSSLGLSDVLLMITLGL